MFRANCGWTKKCAFLQMLSARAFELPSQKTEQTWGMRPSLVLKYFLQKKFQGYCLEEQQNIFSSRNNNKAYSVIPWVHRNLTKNVFTRKNQLWMTFTFYWDSVDLMSLSQLLTHGINATKLFKRVIFPEVSGELHCSLSDIVKNWISCYPCCLTRTSRPVCFTRS